MVRTIYQQTTLGEVHVQLDRVAAQLREPFPTVATVLQDAGAPTSWLSPASRWLTALSLSKGVVQRPAAAAEQGDTLARRRDGHFPKPVCGTPSRWSGPGRAGRRMGRGPPLHHLPQRCGPGSPTGAWNPASRRLTQKGERTLTPVDGTLPLH